MSDIPILFSAPMIAALLAGRKTQTRRVINFPGVDDVVDFVCIGTDTKTGVPVFEMKDATGRHLTRPVGKGCASPHYSPRFAKGDRLWVRETVACGACALGKPSHWAPSFWRREQGTPKNPNGLWYAADDLAPEKPITDRGRWVPGIHMPRWASRLTLTVTDVRVQRLQECSAVDSIAEGAQCSTCEAMKTLACRDGGCFASMAAFRDIWENINGAGAWAANPWVCAISFEVHRRNIDEGAR